MWNVISIDSKITFISKAEQFVLDCVALFQNVRWVQGKAYKETAVSSFKYVADSFGFCSIIFDGIIFHGLKIKVKVKEKEN